MGSTQWVFPTHHVEEEEHQSQISSISSLSSSANDLTSTIHDPVTFYSRLISSVQVHAPSKHFEELPSAPTFQSKSRYSYISPHDLSEQWFIGLKKAKDAIKTLPNESYAQPYCPLPEGTGQTACMKGRDFEAQYTQTQWMGNTSHLTGTNTPKSLLRISTSLESIQWSQKGMQEMR